MNHPQSSQFKCGTATQLPELVQSRPARLLRHSLAAAVMAAAVASTAPAAELLPTSTSDTSRPGWTVLTFGAGSGTWTVPANVTSIDVLVVGGGGGSTGYGGGGGGGGVYSTTAFGVTPGTGIDITVGAGGTGGPVRPAAVGPYPQTNTGGNGENSAFGSFIAYGGQAGEWTWTSSSGGHGWGGTSGGNNQGGTGITADHPTGNYSSGSGAGVKGLTGATSAGGNGLTSTITGPSVYYAGGGGALVNGPGGLGGGGAGHSGGTNNGYPGVANTGGGGGAGHTGLGAAGGSGVVIVAYQNTVTTYTVTFDSNGGSTVASELVVSGTTVGAPTPPTKTGYNFVEWCSDSGLTTTFDFGTAITADRTLYAKWELASFTVTFNTNGGSEVTSQSVIYNTVATAPSPDPTKDGFNFAGWYADAAFTTTFDFATLITGDRTVYARWTLQLQYSPTTVGSREVITFTQGSGTWTIPANVSSIDVLVVGGGGGGLFYGGGGGGGGVYSTSSYSVTPGTSVTVTVGEGGAAGLSRVTDTGSYPLSGAAGTGESSAFGGFVAYGGLGGNWTWTGFNTGYGRGGTSGGNNQGGVGLVAEATADYGSGSGAGVRGASGVSAAGGAGLASSITGSEAFYAGGGGALVQGLGGNGGGGNGSAAPNAAASNGTANTGGGGGGGWGGAGGNGGSGVVIVSYQIQTETPYDHWAATGTFANDFTDTLSTHDPDGDGLTNQAEFAFGLDPTTGASVNPVSPYNPTAHTFTYTRTKDSGLAYNVWISTDLLDWGVEPAAATQEVINTDGTVETVLVTLTSPPGGNKLFLRMQAD